MDDDNTKWESLLYKLRKEFDSLYVSKDGIWRIVVILSLTGAGTILTGFVMALIAVATHRLGL